MENAAPKKLRCWEVDFVRGICIIYVMLYHLCFDVVGMFYMSTPFGFWLENVADFYFFSGFNQKLHMPIVYTLFFISGISKTFTKNDLKRFVKIAIYASIITLATLATNSMFGITIWMGVLHTISLCVLLYYLFDKLVANKYIHIGVGLTLIAIGVYFDINYGTIEVGSFWPIVQGLQGYIISNGDYFPLLPYLGIYIIGAVFGKIVYKTKTSKTGIDCPPPLKPISWCGKYSLHLYLISQVVFMGVLGLLVVAGIL